MITVSPAELLTLLHEDDPIKAMIQDLQLTVEREKAARRTIENERRDLINQRDNLRVAFTAIQDSHNGLDKALDESRGEIMARNNEIARLRACNERDNRAGQERDESRRVLGELQGQCRAIFYELNQERAGRKAAEERMAGTIARIDGQSAYIIRLQNRIAELDTFNRDLEDRNLDYSQNITNLHESIDILRKQHNAAAAQVGDNKKSLDMILALEWAVTQEGTARRAIEADRNEWRDLCNRQASAINSAMTALIREDRIAMQEAGSGEPIDRPVEESILIREDRIAMQEAGSGEPIDRPTDESIPLAVARLCVTLQGIANLVYIDNDDTLDFIVSALASRAKVLIDNPEQLSSLGVSYTPGLAHALARMQQSINQVACEFGRMQGKPFDLLLQAQQTPAE